MKILIVDDSQDKIAEIKTVIRSSTVGAPAEIVIARSGIDARKNLAQSKFDLLILDIRLPFRENDEPAKQGGMDLLHEITLNRNLMAPTHVVALTAYDELREEFLSRFQDAQWALESYDPSRSEWRDRLHAKVKYIERTLNQSSRSHDVDICIIVALASPELDAVRSLPWHWSDVEMMDGATFVFRGEFISDGTRRTVVAAAAPRMGMVASATLAQKLILKFQPRILAMTGICAGVQGKCELGDVIVSEFTWDWQMGKIVEGNFLIAPQQLRTSPEILTRMVLLKQDRQLFFSLTEAFSGDKPNSVPQLRVGPLASGSVVLSDERTLPTIQQQQRNVIGVDMELYGVYSAAYDCCAPKPHVVGIKAVCDFADPNKNDRYQKYAAYMSAEILRCFAERYFSQLFE